MTIKDRRDFNVVGFRSKFANQARESLSSQVNIDKLVVYVVVPEDGKFDSLKCLRFTDGKKQLPDKPTDIEFKIYKVRMEDLDSIFHSIRQLLGEINPQGIGGDPASPRNTS